MAWSKHIGGKIDVADAAVPDWFREAKENHHSDAAIMQDIVNYCRELMKKSPAERQAEDPQFLQCWAELLFDMYSELYEKTKISQ